MATRAEIGPNIPVDWKAASRSINTNEKLHLFEVDARRVMCSMHFRLAAWSYRHRIGIRLSTDWRPSEPIHPDLGRVDGKNPGRSQRAVERILSLANKFEAARRFPINQIESMEQDHLKYEDSHKNKKNKK